MTQPVTDPEERVDLDLATDPGLRALAEQWREAKDAAQQWKDRADSLESDMKRLIGDDVGRLILDGERLASVVYRENTRFDKGKFNDDYPGAYSRYVVYSGRTRYLRRG